MEEKFSWAKKATDVFTEMVIRKYDFVDKVEVYYDSNQDLRILVTVRRPVSGDEIDEVQDYVKHLRTMMRGQPPFFEKGYIPVSIISKVRRLEEQVVKYLRKIN